MIRYATERERMMFQTIRDAFASPEFHFDTCNFNGEVYRPNCRLLMDGLRSFDGLWTYREPDGVSDHARFWFHSDCHKQYDPEARVAEVLAAEYALALTARAPA